MSKGMLRLVALVTIFATSSCGGGGHVIYASDGVPHGAEPARPAAKQFAAWESAAIASGAHDIPCDRGSVKELAWLYGKYVLIAGHDTTERLVPYAVVVEGCGQRLTYLCGDRCILTSRLAVPAAPPRSQENAADGGDRP